MVGTRRDAGGRGSRRRGQWQTAVVVPTMIVAGLVLGRWWAVPLGAVLWAAVVSEALGGPCDAGCLPGAAALGAANTAVGVALGEAVVRYAREPLDGAERVR